MYAQREDEIIAPIYKILEGKLKVDRRTRDTLKKESVILLKQYKKLSIEKGVLMRSTKKYKQVVLPTLY